MASRIGNAVDNAVARAIQPGRLPSLPPDDLPAGDNLAAIRSAYDLIREMGAQLSYYADAARRIGQQRTSNALAVLSQQAQPVLAELERMWLGEDTATPTIVDELRRELGRLNLRVEDVISRREHREQFDNEPPSTSTPSWNTPEGRALIHALHARTGNPYPAGWEFLAGDVPPTA